MTKEIFLGILSCILLVFVNTASSQDDSFFDVLSFPKGNFASQLFETSDGGYIIVSEYLNLFGQVDRQQPVFIKYDACHNFEKSNIYIEEYAILEVSDAVQLQDGRIAITGYMYTGANYDTYILVLDESGDISQYIRFQSEKNEICYSIDQLPSGEIFIYLNHSPISGGPSKNTIILFDENFNIKWQKAFHEIGIWGNAIATSDNGILARAGHVIFKVDQFGNHIFSKTYSPNVNYSMEAVEVNNGYVFAKFDQSDPQQNFILKIDKLGNENWIYESIPFSAVSRLKPTGSNGFTLLNQIHVAGNVNGLILEMSALGDIVNNYSIGRAMKMDEFILQDMAMSNTGEMITLGESNKQMVLIKSELTKDSDCIELGQGIDIQLGNVNSDQANPSISGTTITPIPYDIYTQEFELQIERNCATQDELMDMQIDTVICFGAQIELTVPDILADFTWFDGDKSAIKTVGEAGDYILYLEKCGLQVEHTFSVSQTDCPCILQMPNAFTPNGDGNNDVFAPVGDCNPIEYSFEVFNRWGQSVFSTLDRNVGWDGNYKGKKSPSDVYLYLLSFKYNEQGEIKTSFIKGDITLIR